MLTKFLSLFKKKVIINNNTLVNVTFKGILFVTTIGIANKYSMVCGSLADTTTLHKQNCLIVSTVSGGILVDTFWLKNDHDLLMLLGIFIDNPIVTNVTKVTAT